MPIHVKCSGCGREFRAPDQLAGKRAKCPKCGTAIQVGNIVQPASVQQAGPTPKASVASFATPPHSSSVADKPPDDPLSFLSAQPADERRPSGQTSTLAETRNARSPFVQKLVNQQTEEAKCVTDTMTSLGTALAMFVGGLVLATIGCIIIGVLPQQAAFAVVLILGIGVVAVIGMILYGLCQLIILPIKLLTPKHIVNCPNCSARYTMYKTATFYTCPTCLLPIHFSGETTATEKRACANCGHTFGVDSSASHIRCANCGAVMKEGTLYKDLDRGLCGRCQTRFPKGAFFCPNCLALKAPVDEHLLNSTNDAQLARGPLGIALHIRARLLQYSNIRAEIAETSNWSILLQEVVDLTERIIEASLLSDADCVPHLAKIEGLLDRVYAVSLMRDFMFMQENPKATYPELVVGRLYLYAQPATYREQIHECVTRVAAIGGLRGIKVASYAGWTRPLFDYADYATELKGGTGPRVYRIQNPGKLKAEAVRVWPEISSFVA